MESDDPKRCQWSYCIDEAVKHAVFATRVFDHSSGHEVSDSPFASEHLDLCRKHLELISLQYIHVNEYRLGECPQRHLDPPAAE